MPRSVNQAAFRVLDALFPMGKLSRRAVSLLFRLWLHPGAESSLRACRAVYELPSNSTWDASVHKHGWGVRVGVTNLQRDAVTIFDAMTSMCSAAQIKHQHVGKDYHRMTPINSDTKVCLGQAMLVPLSANLGNASACGECLVLLWAAAQGASRVCMVIQHGI